MYIEAGVIKGKNKSEPNQKFIRLEAKNKGDLEVFASFFNSIVLNYRQGYVSEFPKLSSSEPRIQGKYGNLIMEINYGEKGQLSKDDVRDSIQDVRSVIKGVRRYRDLT